MKLPGGKVSELHHLAPELRGLEWRIHLAGVGGSGSALLVHLARIHLALKALDKPGLMVTAWDPDRIEQSNLVRQRFFASDLGRFKSEVLITRLNLAYPLNWQARTQALSESEYLQGELLIGCVDSAASRRALVGCFSRSRVPYSLDLGNRSCTGQYLLGERPPESRRRGAKTLPLAWKVFPELLEDDSLSDTLPSCSSREALERQNLFVNETVALGAAELLWTLITEGAVSRAGAKINSRGVTGAAIPTYTRPGRTRATRTGQT